MTGRAMAGFGMVPGLLLFRDSCVRLLGQPWAEACREGKRRGCCFGGLGFYLVLCMRWHRWAALRLVAMSALWLVGVIRFRQGVV